MLGWLIIVFRQGDSGAEAAAPETALGAQIGVWQTGTSGTDWLDTLVDAGRAIKLSGNGYPTSYTARASDIIPTIIDSPPGARAVWVAEPTDIVTSKWAGRTVIDRPGVDACRPDEWLLIEAWDES